ncbi:PadR family transcriptional regulator [Pseudarthrobacter sp. J1738]|uniref:PadR family transcriptional regulator n=1 Tax=unclassified Pseudarthrobacter TaxID=2647000 RepID=UPI003D2B7AC8
MTPPVFPHGALRLYLLVLLEEGPKHGYELIKELSERFGGSYKPSAGTIYPRLSKLQEEGLVATETEGRRTRYSVTEAGLTEIQNRRAEIEGVEEGIAASMRRLADDLRTDITTNMRALRADLAATAEAAKSAARRNSVRQPENHSGPGAPLNPVSPGPANISPASTVPASNTPANNSGASIQRLKHSEVLLQQFRDDLRVELRLASREQAISQVTVETIRTVLEQASIAVRNSLRH